MLFAACYQEGKQMKLVLHKEVWEKQEKKNRFSLYEASYEGSDCYCLSNDSTGHKVLFDRDEEIKSSVIRRIKQYGITEDSRSSGARFNFKFSGGRKRKGVSLRVFLFARYCNKEIRNISNHKIETRDKSSYADGIIDMRSNNLYNAGTEPKNYEIVSRPGNPDEKYIIVAEEGNIEIYDYTEQLFYLLDHSSYCSAKKTLGDKKRISVVVHYDIGKTKYKIINLSRFVLLYYQNFQRYAGTRGASKRFIKAFPKLNDQARNEHCAHVNADLRNGTSNNIMFMPSNCNVSMRDLIHRFIGFYGANAIVIQENGKETILVEMMFGKQKKYYRCETPEDYCDLQKMAYYQSSKSNLGGCYRARTPFETFLIGKPSQTYKEHKDDTKEQLSRDETLDQFWKWCDKRDELISLYYEKPEVFETWKADRWYRIITLIIPFVFGAYTACLESDPTIFKVTDEVIDAAGVRSDEA